MPTPVPTLPTIEDALQLALEAHRGQVDKAGEPYILHPLRLMTRMRSPEARLVALLHDVLEDSHFTRAMLEERGYPPHVLDALERLTRRKDESYADFIERLAPDPLARAVKLADLEDNMDVRRLPTVGPREAERLARYRDAWAKLQQLEARSPQP